MRRSITILLCGALCLAACVPPVTKELHSRPRLPDLSYAEDLQAALELALQEAQGSYDLGISAAAAVPGYRPWTGVTGNSRPGVPVTAGMLFNVGSVAKTFEAALALKLAEQGLLDLDAPLSTWLPAHPHLDGRISVRQLLNHTSGTFNVFEHPDFPWVGPEVEYARRWRLEEVLDRFAGEPYGPPGYAQHYSSTNYLLLTAILERAGGAPVPQQVTGLLLDPLQLHAGFMTMGALPPPEFAVVHPWADVDRDGQLDDLSRVPQTWIATLTHPVLYTTPLDMVRWMQALFEEQRVLSKGSLKEMLAIPEDALPDPEGGSYGLGIIDFSEVLGVNAIGHGGSSLGYSAAAVYLPDLGIALAWAINTGESPRTLADALMRSTWSRLSQALFEHQPQVPQGTPQSEEARIRPGDSPTLGGLSGWTPRVWQPEPGPLSRFGYRR
jgi:D-alanyl-D-alanine carboxypeptidase